jgi:outer membrane biosynthesis protein TonB
MQNAIVMTQELEQQRKRNALLLTLGTGGALLLLFILLRWPIPTVSQPVAEEYIDVNLGNGDQGSGTDQPQLPGDPAPAAASYTPPQPIASNSNDAKLVETDDNAPSDAPVIKNPVSARPDATKINDDNKTVKPVAVAKPTPAPPAPKPKAVMGQMTGGSGPGGNDAANYKPGSNEGIAGGSGDQGRNGGDPNGKAYTGTSRRLNAQVISMPTQTMQDDFRESGKVVLDVTVSANGQLQSAVYNPRGSTLPRSSRQAQIALQRARELRFPRIEGGFRQDIQFSFTVGN